MKKVMQPFKAPRKRKEPISPNVQASPTRQSPRRQGKSDSEGQTELVCTRWVVKETQEAERIHSDNDSGAKTDRDECDGNDTRCRLEARSEITTGVSCPHHRKYRTA